MSKDRRMKMVIGNWKMYKTRDDALLFVNEILPLIEKISYTVGLAVPFTLIYELSKQVAESRLLIGAQNMHEADSGAFTGEIAGIMLKDAHASFVLLGHSERRKFFHENDETINKKVLKATQLGVQPIICIGETYDERNNGETKAVLQSMLEKCLQNVTEEQVQNIVIAYEPVWAIGTGAAATVDIISEANETIRTILEEMYSKKVKETVAILYGGSVQKENCQELFFHEAIDGLLIGNASIRPESFAKIIELCQNSSKS